MTDQHSQGSGKASKVDRRQTAYKLLRTEVEKLPAEERAVIERFIARRSVSRNIVREFDTSLSFGERLSDRVAAIGGTWSFIIVFVAVLVVWMLVNTYLLRNTAFDPYPYILLNLCLSCVAAIQAPIIMMSQNRSSAADRMQAEHDYEVNVRSELEIMQMHEKLDQMRERDWATLVELQNRQIELLQKLLERASGIDQSAAGAQTE
ncbi:MAG TPA: DUF1003 domain-containing protein [Dokdonella sp.]|uniref:DUF1003 domain-containing protein n=1 Tax=Dokdonella sp. TaxID=2291710 RepID=UPI002D80C2BD|nr:DUF1003 domain-containing protein [Dokdonella sp.]HET9033471.1 DUF1003 domain-containing protein [Dokdonella sp.]